MRLLLSLASFALFKGASAGTALAVCAGDTASSTNPATQCQYGATVPSTIPTYSGITVTDCLGTLSIIRELNNTNSLTRMIKVSDSYTSDGGDVWAYLTKTAPPTGCPATSFTPTVATDGAGTINVNPAATSASGDMYICPSTSQGGGGDSSLTSCSVASTGTFNDFEFPFTCPAVNADEIVKSPVVTYLFAGAELAASANTYSYATLKISCDPPVNPPYSFCMQIRYCTPYTGAATWGQYSDKCGASNPSTATSIVANCKGPSDNATGITYFDCRTNAGTSTCTSCPTPPVNIPGMRYNTINAYMPAKSQRDGLIAAIRAGSITDVPPWAEIYTGSTTTTSAGDSCGSLLGPIACTGSGCTATNIYPPTSQTSRASVLLDQSQYNTVAANYRGSNSFGADGGTVQAFLFPSSSSSVPATRDRAAEAAQTPTGPSAPVAPVGNIPTTLTSSCANPSSTSPVATSLGPVATSTTLPSALPLISPSGVTSGITGTGSTITSGGNSIVGAASTCCANFYKYAYCTLKFPTFTTCSCGGSAVCPSSINCDSSNKSYLLFLLFLLCIPFWLLICCSIIIACCLIRRRKRGWQERQLATFDPEPHPAAPPPPVNVYEECPAYAHHDGASGYSDVHHTNDEFYSNA